MNWYLKYKIYYKIIALITILFNEKVLIYFGEDRVQGVLVKYEV